MGACACAEERVRVSDSLKIKNNPFEDVRVPPKVMESPEKPTLDDDFSMYGSIGKYQFDKQTGKWRTRSKDVFIGHLTEGNVIIDKGESGVTMLAEFNARICVRFSMPDAILNHPG